MEEEQIFSRRSRFLSKSFKKKDLGTYAEFLFTPPPSLSAALMGGGDGGSQTGGVGGGEKSLLTHKLVNAVALSTFSSNENFRHLHINLISCVSLLPRLH